MKIIILAGGVGTRFWPMSRKNKPKQLCKLLSSKTMLEETVERFKNYPKNKIYISTTKILEKPIREIFSDFPSENFIIEPACRDTAPAMGFVATYLAKKDPDEPIAFIPSDHKIGRVEKLLHCLEEAEQVILKTGKLLDISVYQFSPSTTLGYTKIGKRIMEKDGVEFYEFLGHKEKPDFKTAQKYLESGNYLWHANYYMWTPRKFLEAYQKYAPEMYKTLLKIQSLLGKGQTEKISALYKSMQKISIDYAITEKINANNIAIILGDFDWNDIGAWNTLYENMLTKTDEKKNMVVGDRLNIDTSNCLVYGKENKMIATIGVDDLVIIDTDDALLVCPKSRAQEVKKAVDELKLRGGKYL
ncbi:MAG TPA: mannose-1-phosphate guanylyltransferase [Candidatus Moranbacteria bacterium]|nr:mannose-1-phosphate guanylyltransferase [Candidatus Moranbacteria bacterium]